LRLLRQDSEIIAASLTDMSAEWLDETASRIIETVTSMPRKPAYGAADLDELLSRHFEDGKAICRLFLGLSKDEFETLLTEKLGSGNTGVTAFRRDEAAYLASLLELGVADRMTAMVNTPVVWSDLLIERLRSGRGRAIRGQSRGRSLEDFVEVLLREVFDRFDSRCSFVGKDGASRAKADFAIPSKEEPLIVIESKGYAATGSKQTDVLGDLREIVVTKRHDTLLLFVTDGLTWRRRMSDLRKIVEMQNRGEVARIYTRSMREEFKSDLATLKAELGL
jgi:DpnII restriction endonuclease